MSTATCSMSEGEAPGVDALRGMSCVGMCSKCAGSPDRGASAAVLGRELFCVCAPFRRALRPGPCARRDTPRVPQELIAKHMQQLPLWTLDESGKMISRRAGAPPTPASPARPATRQTAAAHRRPRCRRFTARNFVAAMRFLNEVAELAERETHHPDFHLTSFRRVVH